jgi:hypothetical protein
MRFIGAATWNVFNTAYHLEYDVHRLRLIWIRHADVSLALTPRHSTPHVAPGRSAAFCPFLLRHLSNAYDIMRTVRI